MNRLLLDALKCKNTSRPPVWLMRQAGRYMPEYRAIRAKHSFLEMCHNPELIAEVTQLPLHAFGMDAAILFSDILVIPEALNVGLRFEDGRGPIIENKIQSRKDIEALPSPDIGSALNYVAEGIKLVLPALKVPLIGFCGAPFTVASYMIEGGSSKDLRKTKQFMVRDPEGFHLLLSKIADCSIAYLKMQIQAGVQALQIFDSWAYFLSHAHFREFSLAYLKKILDAIGNEVPVIVFCRGASVFGPQLAEISPAGISVDWQADLAHMRQKVPETIALQGNLDPDVLYGDAASIRKAVTSLIQSMRQDKGFIFNLGHGMHPDIPTDAVRVLVETVQSS